MNILVIPDSHASPDTSNRRFEWLGNFILEQDPDVIVNIGDQADLNSLSSYDKGKKSFEGRRYRHDVDAVIDSLQKINSPLENFNKQRKNIRKAQRRIPRKILTLGNHEIRILRAIQNNPELDGVLSIEDFRYREFGWEVIPFLEPISIEGVWFCHYYPSGVKGEAIGGYNIASSLLQKNMVSSVCGHSHLYDHAIRSRPDGSKVIGLNVGWYGEQATYESATQSLWWSGLVMLRDVHEGTFDVEQYSIERVQKYYA